MSINHLCLLNHAPSDVEDLAYFFPCFWTSQLPLQT